MVRFEKDKLVIEILSPQPVETWLEIHAAMCDVVRSIKQEDINKDNFFYVIDLIGDIMPDYDDAVRMKR